MITLDPRQESGRPLYWQIYAQIRRDITSGALPARDKLPSPRWKKYRRQPFLPLPCRWIFPPGQWTPWLFPTTLGVNC